MQLKTQVATKKILIVEDDLNLGFLLMEILQDKGFHVKMARNGQAGLDSIQKERFDLCILDIMMPRMNGYDLAKYIKTKYPKIPFLFLSAKSLKEDKLKGYQLGAEDFVLKPFDEEELLCKVNVILRRLQSDDLKSISGPLKLGRFTYDYKRQELCIDDHVIRMTEKENEVLYLLCLHKNEILRRDYAVEKIYGKQDYFLGRSFDVFISRLRKILSKDPSITIENVFKVGFILNVKND